MKVDTTGTDIRPVKLACKGLWKLFGANAESFIKSHPEAKTREEFEAAGLIAGVRDVSIEVSEGEVFVIMGLSGSGKSTLLRCLSRLLDPTIGEIIFEGRDLLKVSDAELIEIRRHKMGMVFQHFALLPHLTVLENVGFPLSVQGVGRAQRDETAREMVQLVGLSGREHAFPRELSGGQQQRVGIARSLATKPQLWFLDEPFSALDPLIRRELQDELLRLQKVLKKTIFFITHDFDEAIRLADRIAIMKDGAIIQVGTPEELVTNPATDYVAEFTREVQRSKVVSASGIMTPCSGLAAYPKQVDAGTRVIQFASEIVSLDAPFGVMGENGALIGEVTPRAVIELLAGVEHRP